MSLKISGLLLCADALQHNGISMFFLLFVLAWQSWPLISILPIMQMSADHILVQMSKASAEARSPLGPSGNLHLKAILCAKTMAQVLCPWPRALSSPVRQKVGVTPVFCPFCQLLARLIQTAYSDVHMMLSPPPLPLKLALWLMDNLLLLVYPVACTWV